MKVLIFQPHNDDAIVSIGGIIQKLIRNNCDIQYVYMTDGRHGSNIMTPEETLKVRAKEAKAEREFLNVKNFYEFKIEDGSLGKLKENELKKIKAKILEIIKNYNPDIVFIPTISDMHIDHRATHDIVWSVIKSNDMNVLIAKYVGWLFPDFYQKKIDVSDKILLVGITNEIKRKLEAIRLHKSQVKEGHFDILVGNINLCFGQIFSTYKSNGMNYAEIIALFNRNKSNQIIEENLIKKLDNPMDITVVFHGRSEKKISA